MLILGGAGVGGGTWPQCPLPLLKVCNQLTSAHKGLVRGDRDTSYHCPGEPRNQVNVSSLEKVRCQLLMLPRGRQCGSGVWSQKHPGLILGPATDLFHGLGQVALPLPWASIFSSIK